MERTADHDQHLDQIRPAHGGAKRHDHRRQAHQR
jgi:hypothetical protein